MVDQTTIAFLSACRTQHGTLLREYTICSVLLPKYRLISHSLFECSRALYRIVQIAVPFAVELMFVHIHEEMLHWLKPGGS